MVKKVLTVFAVIVALYVAATELLPNIITIFGWPAVATSVYLTAFIIYCAQGIVFGFITRYIACSKGYDGGFWWGFFLGVLGLIVVCVRPAIKQGEAEHIQSEASNNNIETLERLARLKESGMISDEEFEAKKQELLSRI